MGSGGVGRVGESDVSLTDRDMGSICEVEMHAQSSTIPIFWDVLVHIKLSLSLFLVSRSETEILPVLIVSPGSYSAIDQSESLTKYLDKSRHVKLA